MESIMEEKKKAEALEKLLEILLSAVISTIRFCGAWFLYGLVIVPVFGAPPITAWQALGIWWFIKFILGFK